MQDSCVKNLVELPIGVFDSGVGGLTVLKEIRRFTLAIPHVYPTGQKVQKL